VRLAPQAAPLRRLERCLRAAWCSSIILLACGGTDPRIVFHERGEYGDVYVVDQGGRRALRFGGVDGENQSEIVVGDPAAVPMEYVRLAAVSLAHTERPRRVMMIGLGGGAFSTMLWRAFPDLRIDVVEIDPIVVKAARALFGVPADDPRYRIFVEDGLEYVRKNDGPYDLIFVDAYNGADIPDHLAGREFFVLLEGRLGEGGVVVLNVAIADEQEPALLDEFRAVFGDPACYRAEVDDNLIVVGGRGPSIDVTGTGERLFRLRREANLPFDLGGELARRVDCSRVGPGH